MNPISFNFNTFKRNDKPNSYLVCPENLCTTKIDAPAPVYPVNVRSLEMAWQAMIASQPRVKLISSDPKNYLYQYIQRSFLFRFPDFIVVKLIPIDNHTSTLAIYSHAIYGYYDFHVNEKRVLSWLAQLHQLLPS